MRKDSGNKQLRRLCFGTRTSRIISKAFKASWGMPDPFKYIPDISIPKTVKPLAKPFGIGAKLNKTPKFLTPPPGTYSPYTRQRKVRVCTAFGHDRIPIPYCQICCYPVNLAFCWKCKTTPIGDYWDMKNTNLYLCRPCMEPYQKKFRKTEPEKRELAKYVLTRHCEFYHTHPGGMKAAVRHMPAKYLKMKFQKEIYFASFGL